MSRLTQTAVVSPERLPLPLCHGGCDKISWLPEGKVFSNVQREKIISKFLKESVLKRVFRSKQMRWEGPDYQKEDPSYSFPGTRTDTFLLPLQLLNTWLLEAHTDLCYIHAHKHIQLSPAQRRADRRPGPSRRWVEGSEPGPRCQGPWAPRGALRPSPGVRARVPEAREAGRAQRGGLSPVMAEGAGPPLRRPRGAQGQEPQPDAPRRRGPSRGSGARGAPAAPNPGGPGGTPGRGGRPRRLGAAGRPGRRGGPRRRSLGRGPPPRPSSPEGRRPRPSVSSRRRKAGPEGAHAEGPGPRGGGALGADGGDDTGACGAAGILRKQRSKMGRRNGEHCGPSLRVSSISHENLSHWNLDSEVPVPENRNLPPGRDSAAGGKINKDHLEIPVEQLMLDLNLSEHAHKRTQNSKQGIFQLWSYPLNEGSTPENRDFKNSSMETGFTVTNSPIRLFTLQHSLTGAPADKQVGSYPGLQMPLGFCWSYADGDFFKDRNEPHINLCSTIENNNSETFSAPNWNLKYGNSSVEENLTDESDLSENEKANDTLLSYFKKMDLNLKPETIENVEESFIEEPSEVFPYPDFLPPPFNTLDLHKLALSKSENWKATVEPPESSLEHLITRLLEMERLQHMTIQKERPKLQTTFCTPAVTERPSSSKAIPKMRQPKLSDSLSLQTTCVDKSREKRKTNSGSCKLEQNASKWNWSNAGKYKWNSRPASLKSPSTTKQLRATYDDFRNPKSSILNPCQELSTKPATAQTTPLLIKMVSTRGLLPRSPVPVSPIPLSFPENQREEIKAPRTKKKLYRKNILLNRPFYIQKLNCLSPSFIAKDKCPYIDQK